VSRNTVNSSTLLPKDLLSQMLYKNVSNCISNHASGKLHFKFVYPSLVCHFVQCFSSTHFYKASNTLRNEGSHCSNFSFFANNRDNENQNVENFTCGKLFLIYRPSSTFLYFDFSIWKIPQHAHLFDNLPVAR
jgi:hypothetical protein